jgi:hypothetical protein
MRPAYLAAMVCLTACASSGQFAKTRISNIYVADFKSDDQSLCDAMDVPIEHAEAVAFFKRATVIDYKSYDDNYPYALCRVVGTLQYDGKPCNWEITPVATGVVTCNGHETYFACENCKDLFKTEQCPPQKPCNCQP